MYKNFVLTKTLQLCGHVIKSTARNNFVIWSLIWNSVKAWTALRVYKTHTCLRAILPGRSAENLTLLQTLEWMVQLCVKRKNVEHFHLFYSLFSQKSFSRKQVYCNSLQKLSFVKQATYPDRFCYFVFIRLHTHTHTRFTSRLRPPVITLL